MIQYVYFYYDSGLYRKGNIHNLLFELVRKNDYQTFLDMKELLNNAGMRLPDTITVCNDHGKYRTIKLNKYNFRKIDYCDYENG